MLKELMYGLFAVSLSAAPLQAQDCQGLVGKVRQISSQEEFVQHLKEGNCYRTYGDVAVIAPKDGPVTVINKPSYVLVMKNEWETGPCESIAQQTLKQCDSMYIICPGDQKPVLISGPLCPPISESQNTFLFSKCPGNK
jgi:hypothetical protein